MNRSAPKNVPATPAQCNRGFYGLWEMCEGILVHLLGDQISSWQSPWHHWELLGPKWKNELFITASISSASRVRPVEESRCLCCLPCLPCLPVSVLPVLQVASSRTSIRSQVCWLPCHLPRKPSQKFSRYKCSHRSPCSRPKGWILAALTETKPSPVKFFYLDEF